MTHGTCPDQAGHAHELHTKLHSATDRLLWEPALLQCPEKRAPPGRAALARRPQLKLLPQILLPPQQGLCLPCPYAEGNLHAGSHPAPTPERVRVVAQTTGAVRRVLEVLARSPRAPGRARGGPTATTARGTLGLVSLSRAAGGVAMDHRSRPRVPAPGAERARAQAGSAVNGHASRRRASRPPASSLHYRNVLRNGPERGPTRPGHTETPLLLSSHRAISLKRPGLPAGAARHHRRLTLGGARGPQRRSPQAPGPILVKQTAERPRVQAEGHQCRCCRRAQLQFSL